MLIDAHAHLDMYEDAIEPVLAEIAERSILTLSNSLDATSYEKNLAIAEMSKLVVPLFGVHPWMAPKNVSALEELTDALDRTPMIGEIGLDHRFVEDESQYPAQRDVFEFFLQAAKERDKSVNIHTSGAEEEVLRLLDEYAIGRVIVHWYSGPVDTFHALAERGAYFTMNFSVSHSDHLRELAAAVPEDRLLTETDNPGGPKWLLGKPGEPSLLQEAIDALAEIRGATPEAIVEAVERNFATFLRADPHLSRACGELFEGSE
jgi:TatD DNase family protein